MSAKSPCLWFALAVLVLASPGQAEVAGEAEVVGQAEVVGEAEVWFRKGRQLAARPESVQEDPLEWVRWYLKAARAGHPRAQVQLGLALQRGDGIEKDVRRSVGYFRKAAEQGNAKAMLELGSAYRDGIGVPVDRQRALMWLRLAQLRGSGLVRFIAPGVRRQLSSEQIREAQRLAAAWLADRNFEVKGSPTVQKTSPPSIGIGAKTQAPAAGAARTDGPGESAGPAPGG
ncbi:MAG: sel1 repeat family protein [Myxococcales bacterium]|nr:sel1 repeat family protein [Myxococcales bacterium]